MESDNGVVRAQQRAEAFQRAAASPLQRRRYHHGLPLVRWQPGKGQPVLGSFKRDRVLWAWKFQQ